MRWLSRLLHRRKQDAELDSELRFHIEQQIAEYVASGIAPDEARRRARHEFGGLDQVKEQVHAARRGYLLETLLQDLRYGLRMLRKSPGFTAVAVITLALGIGANTAIFSVINALLLRPLPVSEPHQLVQLSQADAHGNKYLAFAHPTFEEVAKDNHSLSGVAAFLYLPRPLAVIYKGRAELASAMLASHDYFSMLGIGALQGRVFTNSDGTLGNDHLAVISYGYWTRRFDRDPKVIGESVSIDKSLFTIIGVTPPDFYGIEIGHSPDLTIPETMQPELISVGGRSFLDNPSVRWVEIIARLKAGTPAQTAEADLSRIVTATSKSSESLRLELVPFAGGLNSDLRGRFALPLEILLALTLLVLLVTCANLGAMLLVRGQARRHEIAVRLAIGAGTRRLFQQLFIEGAIVASLAGFASLLVGFWCSHGLVSLMSTATAPTSLNVPVDLSVLAFTAAISFLACVITGVFPIWRALRIDLTSSLNQGAASATGRRSRFGLGGVLIASQIGVSVVLLIVAGLFVQTLRDLSKVDLGFDPHNLLLFSWDPTAGNTREDLNQLYLRLLNGLRAEPGIRSVSFSVGGPMAGGWGQQIASVDGINRDINVMQAAVGPDYFKTLRISVLQGRDFAATDGPTSPPVVVLSQSAARAAFGSASPLGRRIRIAGEGPSSPTQANSMALEVIGLVRDTRFNGIRNTPPAVIYTSYLQRRLGAVTFELRTNADPSTLEPAVRREASSIDMSVPVFDIETMHDYLYDLLRNQRILAIFATIFSLFLLAVVTLGLYGSLSYAVGRRTHEIGVRMAFGAQQNHILRIVMLRGVALASMGIVVGILAGLGLTRFLESELWGISATDPTAFLASVIVLTIATGAASYIPARRAMRVDPMVALRHE